MGKDLHSVNRDEWVRLGEVGVTPLGRGAKVGQGLLFAIVCNCTHLKPQSTPPSPLDPHLSVHSCPPCRPPRRPRDSPSHPEGTRLTNHCSNKAVGVKPGQSETGSCHLRSVINYPQFPGALLQCNHIAQQAGSKWF